MASICNQVGCCNRIVEKTETNSLGSAINACHYTDEGEELHEWIHVDLKVFRTDHVFFVYKNSVITMLLQQKVVRFPDILFIFHEICLGIF